MIAAGPRDATEGVVNERLTLSARPDREDLGTARFAAVTAPLAPPDEGQALVRVFYLGFDPAQRGWMDATSDYIEPVRIGDVMRGMAVGEVIASRNPRFAPGSIVAGEFGWQRYALVDSRSSCWPVPPGLRSAEALGALGTPGLTAYFGMTDIARPQPGQVVVVSGAAGATGSIAAQIARMAGSRVIGIAGRPDKADWLRSAAGLDAAIDYKNEDLGARLGELAPDGVDILFDNVGGRTLEVVIEHLAIRARVALCGAIATRYAPIGAPAAAIRNLPVAIFRRATIRGFLVIDYAHRFPEARRKLASWVESGQLRTRIDLQRGDLTDAPATLARLFDGRNFGKQVLQIAEPPAIRQVTT